MTYEKAPRLWVPGQNNDLADEYPVPPQEELISMWQSYNPKAELVEAPGVYGVMTVPSEHEAPRAYVSLDVCEVMRDSHLAIRSILFANQDRFVGNMHQYAAGTCLEALADQAATLRVMMNAGLVQPVKNIDEIAHIVEEVAEMGAYVFANTSAMPGCEPGTIDFLKEHVPVGLQGIAFPRNFDGSLPFTKGHVLRNVIERFPSADGNIIAIKIDDAPHHTISVRSEVGKLPNSEVVTITPKYTSHLRPDPDTILADTPFEAFQIMYSALKSRLD